MVVHCSYSGGTANHEGEIPSGRLRSCHSRAAPFYLAAGFALSRSNLVFDMPTTSVTGEILIDFLVLAALCALLIALLSRRSGDAVNHRYACGALIAIVIAAEVTSMAKLAEVHRFVPNSAILGLFHPACRLACPVLEPCQI